MYEIFKITEHIDPFQIVLTVKINMMFLPGFLPTKRIVRA